MDSKVPLKCCHLHMFILFLNVNTSLHRNTTSGKTLLLIQYNKIITCTLSVNEKPFGKAESTGLIVLKQRGENFYSCTTCESYI